MTNILDDDEKVESTAYDSTDNYKSDDLAEEIVVNEDVEEVEREDLEELNNRSLPKPAEVVQKAKKYGHLSRDEYMAKYGTMDGYKDEETFNKFGDSYSEVKDILKGMNKKIEAREKENEALVHYISNVKERERKAARDELTKALKEAAMMGDVNAVQDLTREQTKLDYQDAQEAASKTVQTIQQFENEFRERNPWYEKDAEMTRRSIEIDEEIRSGKYDYLYPKPQTYVQLSRQIELVMKQEYPDRVNGYSSNRSAPTVSSAQSGVAKNSKSVDDSVSTFRGLDEEHKAIYNATKRMLEKNGIQYSQKDFINKLRKDGEI